MKWQTLDTFPYPKETWDYTGPRFIFFSRDAGIVIGRCVLTDYDADEYMFTFDREGFDIEPTHWMPLPDRPALPSGSAISQPLTAGVLVQEKKET